ncbi:MAG: hypothetical protein LBL04_13965, partial [Bacteroidales bacterium]|nr:hypothetical protein [Bacteroidales bacterium]
MFCAFENTDYGSGDGVFVPVERIDFASSAHILLTLQANLNAVCQLSEAVVFPQNATNKQIEWTAQGATINGGSLIFDKPGTATVTAAIQRGALNADGNQATYTQTWTVGVLAGNAGGNIIFDGQTYPIVATEFSAGSAVDGLYRHNMKFYINSAQYLQLSLITERDVFAGGRFNLLAPGAAVDVNTVTGFVNFTVATGTIENLIHCNTQVVAERRPDNTLMMDFQGALTQHTGKYVSIHFEGAYAITDPGAGTDPNPNPEQMITFSGTEYPIVKTEFNTQSWTSADGSITAKCQKMRFYINSARYAEITIISNADEVATGSYIIGNIGSNDMIGKAEVLFNFTTATGTTDYAQAGGNFRVVRNSDGAIRVEFVSVATMAANLPVRLLYVGAYSNTGGGTEPEKPTLGNMYVNQTPYNLTGCEVSYDYQTQIARVEFTGKDCYLWFETYLQGVDEAQPPMLNGTFTVKYLDPNGTNWGERFNNMAFAARVHAVGPHSDWGDWQSGLREGTQIRVNMNTQKINVGIQNADI